MGQDGILYILNPESESVEYEFDVIRPSIRKKKEREALKKQKKNARNDIYNLSYGLRSAQRQVRIYSKKDIDSNLLVYWQRLENEWKSNLEAYEIKEIKPVFFTQLAYNDNKGSIIYSSFSKLINYEPKRSKNLFHINNEYVDVPFKSIASSVKNNLLVLGTEDAKVMVYELDKGKTIKVFMDHLSEVKSIEFNHDESLFATTGKDRSIIIWDSKSLKKIKRLYSRAFPISCIAPSNNSQAFVFGNEIGFVKTIDLAAADFDLNIYKNHALRVSVVKFFPNDELLISGGYDNKIVLRHTLDEEDKVSIKFLGKFGKKPKSDLKLKMPFLDKLKVIEAIDISTDGQKFAVGGRRSLGKNSRIVAFLPVSIYDTKSLLLEKEFNAQPELMPYEGTTKPIDNSITSLKFHPVYNTIISGNLYKNIYWNLGGEVPVAEKEIIKSTKIKWVTDRRIMPLNKSSVEWINNNTLIFNTDSTLIVYDLKNEKEISTYYNPLIKAFAIDTTKNMIALAVNKNIEVFTYNKNSDTIIFQGHTESITGLIFLHGTDLLASASMDGTVKIWDVLKSELIGTIVPIDKNKIIFFTPDLYYMTTKSSLDGVGFKLGTKLFPPEQFDLKYNRPDIILSRLNIISEEFESALKKAYQKRLKKVGFTEEMLGTDFHVPQIKLVNISGIPATVNENTLNLVIEAFDEKYLLDRINIWINDVAVYGSNGINVKNLETQKYKNEITLELARGKNKIQLSALNQKGVESFKETINITYQSEEKQPDLYIVSIGISEYLNSDFNLGYAAKDAVDIGSLFQTNDRLFGNVFQKVLTDDQVTKQNIKGLRTFIEKAGRDDVVMVFIAGHGVLDEELDYYYCTYDVDFNNPSEKGINYNEIEALLDGIKALRKILFMDTCHSGEVEKDEVEFVQLQNEEHGDITFRSSGVGIRKKEAFGTVNTSELMKELFTDLRRGTGATVISSAGGAEYAMESQKWRNGLFTYCLINGLQNKDADLNKNGNILLSELQSYIREQVVELSNGMQMPTSRIENISMDFRIW
ncbi:caspase family protein [Bacteroidota bacterium]